LATWNTVKAEVDAAGGNLDGVRRTKLLAVEAVTHRPLIIYATDFLHPEKVRACQGQVGLAAEDKEGFIEVTSRLSGDQLDVLLHSPGGEPEAAESIVEILRSKFRSIRFVVPDAAKSAAAMLALSGDEILMDATSELGPTDPQMLVPRDAQTVIAPAHAILEQFRKAEADLSANPNKTPVWLPILRLYGPSLLIECENAINLTKTLVADWLERYMFAGQDDARKKASGIAEELGSQSRFLSHGRRIGIQHLKDLGVKVANLADDAQLQKAVWELYTAISLTFEFTGAFKLFENGHGDALIRLVQTLKLPLPQPLPPQPRPDS